MPCARCAVTIAGMADAETIVLALIKRMVETGALDMDDINSIADELAAEDADSAHQVRMSALEAMIGELESNADYQANVRRKSIRLVDADGGNSEG